MTGVSYSLQTQAANAEALSLALQRAASVLASKSWSVRNFANVFHDAAVPGEQATSFDSQSPDALLPYVERFSPFGESLQGYESNDLGLDQLRFEFEDLGSGQLVARFYNELQPGESTLAETYLVSLVAEPDGKSYGEDGSLNANCFSNFELALIGTEDQDGSNSQAIGSFNLDSEILSLVENSKDNANGISASTGIILTSNPFAQQQLQAAEVAALAQAKAAEFLANSTWTFQDYANLLHDADLPGEPVSGFSGQAVEALMPYVNRYDRYDGGLSSYELNRNGLDQLRFEFEDLGSGQLVARLYNELQLGGSNLAETYLMSVIAEPAEKSIAHGEDLSVNDFKNFELSFVGYEDFDGSQSGGVGSINLDSGVLSLVENSKAVALGVSSSSEMILTSGSGAQEQKQAQALDLALERAVNFLSESTWSFQQFSNVFQDAELPGEPETPFDNLSPDALMPYVERFDVFGDALIGYDLNRNGLDQLRFEFEAIGSGQVVARLYNELQPGESTLAETYLVSLIAESSEKGGDSFAVDEFSDFELSFVGIEDQDGSQSFGLGSLNLDSGLLSFAENTKGLGLGLTSSTEMILAAYS